VFPQLGPDTAQFAEALTTCDRVDGTSTRRELATPFGLMRLVVGDKP
jgi:hypothetical protein